MVLENPLTLVTFMPLAVALGLLATSLVAQLLGADGLPKQVWKGVGLASTLITFGVSLILFSGFDTTNPGFQFVDFALSQGMLCV